MPRNDLSKPKPGLIDRIIKHLASSVSGLAEAVSVHDGGTAPKGPITKMYAGKEEVSDAIFQRVFNFLVATGNAAVFGLTCWQDLTEQPTSSGSQSPTPAAPADTVSLLELGKFLNHYKKQINLHDKQIAERFCDWRNKGIPQWTPGRLDVQEIYQYFMHAFPGGEDKKIPFAGLQQLLRAFNDPDNPHDVPVLMAEWFCARPESSAYVHLALDDFVLPPDTASNTREAGVQCEYRNAPIRLKDMECAFVRFELAANTVVFDGDPTPDDAIAELLSRPIDDARRKDVPHSHLHVHPGDEIVFVTSGTMYLELENTGIWTPIRAGDFLHFNAEIPHALWNLGRKPAVAIIIRVFQLERHGTRTRQIGILGEIERKMKELGDMTRNAQPESMLEILTTILPDWAKGTKHLWQLWKEIAPWVHDRTRRPQDRLRKCDENSPVKDLVGLSEFLIAYIEGIPEPELMSQPGLRELQRAIRSRRGPSSGDSAIPQESVSFEKALRAYMANFLDSYWPMLRTSFRGVPEEPATLPTSKLIAELSKQLSMPRVLLDGYLAPNALRVVAIRGGARANSDHPYDWVSPPLDDAPDSRSRYYMIPARTLANSDISIVLLCLVPDTSSEWNRHPGYEVMIPMIGEMRIEIGELHHEEKSKPAQNGSLLVYRSSKRHRVVNPSKDKSARAIVIRFNI